MELQYTLSEAVDRERLKAFPNVTISGNVATFKGITQDEAKIRILCATEKRATFTQQSALRDPNDQEVMKIKSILGAGIDLSRHKVVELVATTSKPDSFKERIEKSFQEAVFAPAYAAGKSLLFNHDLNIPVGTTFDAHVDNDGTYDILRVKAVIAPSAKLPSGTSAQDAVAEGMITSCSVSWFPTQNTMKVVDIGGEKILTNFYTGGEIPRVRELSICPEGAHPDAKIVFKSIEFIPIVENMEVKIKIAGIEKSLAPDAVQPEIDALEASNKALAAQVEAMKVQVKEAKNPTIDRIQHLEKSLKQKDLDAAGMEAQRAKLSEKSFDDLYERVQELEAMEKAIKPVMTPATESDPAKKEVLKYN